MKQYHLQLSEDQVRDIKVVLMPGDPQRVEKIAAFADMNSAQLIARNREYTSCRCKFQGIPLLITSTGIGGPSLAIAVEELARIGIEVFIRVGTTGAIQPHINLGDLIITTGAVRLDGTSSHYAPLEYPAVASYEVITALKQSCDTQNLPYHLGITASSDSFYPGQERYDTYSGYVIKSFQGSLEQWRKLRVLNYEMEAATLFTLAGVFNLKSGAICGAIVNRTQTEKPDDSLLELVETRLGKIGLLAAAKLSS
ncbi:MAG: uridine phosphorylase [Desulfuromonas sp. SDB]|nr:MAG: uridine phosphorylase [Desulfuromonas sp. SDB]